MVFMTLTFKEALSRHWAISRAASEKSEPGSADPQGQVALMLCESILHVLVDGGFITKATGVEAIETVRDTTRELAEDDPTPANHTAADLAMEILRSFEAK
jgi:hypothetical protein